MLGKIIALFILVPIVELILLIKVGEIIGIWYTIGLVILTGFLGAIAAKFEGMRVWHEAQKELMRFEVPADRLIDGLMILIGAIFLLTPGILTDITGFALIIPFTRAPFRKMLKNNFMKRQASHQGWTKVEVIQIDSTSQNKNH